MRIFSTVTVLLGLVSWTASASTKRAQVVFLLPDRAVSGMLAAGGARVYRLALTGGMRVILDQRDADFAVDVLDSGLKVERTVDAFEYGTETISLRADRKQVVSLRVLHKPGENVPATYSLKVIALETPAKEEDAYRDAEDASTSARHLLAEGSADSLKKAVEAWRGATKLWQVAGDRSAFLRANVSLADTLQAMHDYPEARRIYGEALELSRTIGDRRSSAECLNNRGLGYWETGSYPEAYADLKAALEYWKLLPAQSGQGATFSNLGLLYWQVGDYQSALESHMAALRVLTPLGNRRGQAYVLNNLALTYGALGDYPRSATFFERASTVFEQLRDMSAAGRPLVNSARVYLLLNDPQRAARNLLRGFPMVKRSGDPRALAEAWNLMGEVSSFSHHTARALQQHNKALGLFREAGDPRGEANAITNLGLASLAGGDTAGAIQHLEEAADLHHRLGTPASEASVLYHLARAQREAGNLDEARRRIDSAIAIGEGIRGGLAGENLRVSYLASIHDFYRESIDVLMAMSRERGDHSLVEEAWNVSERSRARALVEAIGSDRLSSHDPQSGGLLDRRQRQLERVNVELAQLTRVGTEESRKRLEGLLAELQEIDTRLRASDGGYRFVMPGLSPSLSEVQHELLDSDTVLLEYALGEKASYLWVIDRSGITPYWLPSARTLAAQVRSLSILMNGGSHDARTADLDPMYRRGIRALAKELIEPAVPQLKAKRLLIVPDGALQAAPFAALPIERGEPLLEKFEIVSLPSASTLSALRTRDRARQPPSDELAVLADPVFDSSDTRVKKDPATKPGTGPSPYARLPFSRKEALSIAALWPAGKVKLLLGFDASLEAFSSGALGSYGTLHISTHSTADFVQPERSRLVLSLAARDGTTRPGVLALDRIYRLDLNASLLVLSGCQTALGKDFGGEGSLSLSRAFLFAGADRVVASLWRVDDEATAELLVRFYGAMRKTTPEPPAAALRSAQRAIRGQSRWRSPFYWAAWVLQGEP
jgi:CHAT domain-containing protein/tetratricopeptide (TPR) repeat protein